MAKDNRLNPADFVRKLAPAGKAADMRVLSGLLGEGEGKGKLRLYETPVMDSFIELSRADVLHIQRPEENAERGGAMVWVKATAKVRRVGPAMAAPGDFLGGGVVDTYLPVTSMATPTAFNTTLTCATFVGTTIIITIVTYSTWHTCYTHLCPILSWDPNCPFGDKTPQG